MQAIEVKNLSFSYPGGNKVLDGISFSVSEGEVFVIAGLSGSGKTTLCRILNGIIPHAVKGTLTGEVLITGQNPVEIGLAKTALLAGMVFQDADSQIVCSTLEDEIAFGLENLCVPPSDIRVRVDELLTEFGLYGRREMNPSRLSGGQKKLLTIAAALAPSPPVLILDEPLSSLDEDGCAVVCAAIERQKRQGRTVIIVEHDLPLAAFADRWLLLHDGKIAALDTPEHITGQSNILKELRLLL